MVILTQLFSLTNWLFAISILYLIFQYSLGMDFYTNKHQVGLMSAHYSSELQN